MNLKTLAVSLALAMCAPLAANAITIDFTGNGNDAQSSLGFSSGGVDVTATALSPLADPGIVTQTNLAGLGVLAGETNRIIGSAALILTFSDVVTLTDFLLIENGPEAESFNVSSGAALFTGSFGDNSPGATFASSTDLGFGSLTGTVFTFFSDDIIGPGQRGFQIGSVDFVSEVPLPAPLALLLVAIAGLGFAARKRRAAA